MKVAEPMEEVVWLDAAESRPKVVERKSTVILLGRHDLPTLLRVLLVHAHSQLDRPHPTH